MCLISVEARRVVMSFGTTLTDGYDQPLGFWEPSREPLAEQHVSLTTEPSLQTPT